MTNEGMVVAELSYEINNPYKNCDAVRKMRERYAQGLPVRIFVTDLDGALIVEKDQELALVTNEVREKLEQDGWVIIADTSKPSEMAQTKKTYEMSVANGYNRLPPKVGIASDGTRFVIPPEEYYPVGMLDMDAIIGTTGTEIVVKNGEGYIPDRAYQEKRMKVDKQEWRAMADKIIRFVNRDGRIHIGEDIDTLENYKIGVTDIEPPDYRMPLSFESIDDYRLFRDRLMLLKMGIEIQQEEYVNAMMQAGLTRDDLDSVLNMRLVNDSKSNEKIFYFLMPPRVNKARGMEDLINNLIDESGVPEDAIEVVYFGDSYADVLAMLAGGTRIKRKTAVLAAGSRLTMAFTVEGENFAGVNFGPIRNRMVKTEDEGVYQYRPYVPGQNIRFIVGDEVCPEVAMPNGRRRKAMAVDTINFILDNSDKFFPPRV